MALQIPQVDNLFTNIAYDKKLSACRRRFDHWKEYSNRKRREHEILAMIKDMMAITIQKIIRGKVSRNRVKRMRHKIQQEQSSYFYK